jgi:hypothetical protein
LQWGHHNLEHVVLRPDLKVLKLADFVNAGGKSGDVGRATDFPNVVRRCDQLVFSGIILMVMAGIFLRFSRCWLVRLTY